MVPVASVREPRRQGHLPVQCQRLHGQQRFDNLDWRFPGPQGAVSRRHGGSHGMRHDKDGTGHGDPPGL